MPRKSAEAWTPSGRRYFIGGSDARIIMGDDEAALLRLWRGKRGEVEPEELSGNLIVRLGVVTEPLNRDMIQTLHRPDPREVRSPRKPACGSRARQSEKSHWLPQMDSSPPLRLRMKKTRRAYFRLGTRGLRRLRPSPPPFSSMNTTPARSRAARIASTASTETCRRSFSKSTTVESPSLAACASCDCVISRSPRAARHCAGVILSTIFVDMPSSISYQQFLLMTDQLRQALQYPQEGKDR